MQLQGCACVCDKSALRLARIMEKLLGGAVQTSTSKYYHLRNMGIRGNTTYHPRTMRKSGKILNSTTYAQDQRLLMNSDA